MLRLGPSHLPLWRTDSSLQLGSDGAVRLDDVTYWQEQLLDALQGGIPDAMLLPFARSLGADSGEAKRFIGGIGAALSTEPADALPVRAELPDEISTGEAEALVQGWRAGGLDPRTVTRWHQDATDAPQPLIVVADRLVDPRRAAVLMASDVTHLPIELGGDRVIVGPLVVPGITACLACSHTHRTDRDAHWPLVAAQLLGRQRTTTDTGLVLEAAVLAARLLRVASAGATARTDAVTLSVTLSSADVRRVWRAHRPHARCLCRSPEGSVSADARATPTAPTTTATAFARPA